MEKSERHCCSERCRCCSCCCRRTWQRVLCLALLLPFVIAAWQDSLLFLYMVLETWNDGIPLVTAIKDTCYELSEVGYKGFVLLGIGRSLVEVRVEEGDDHITAVCKTSIYVKTTEVSGVWPILDTSDPVPTRERLAAYIQACREVYGGLDPAGLHRAMLDAFVPTLGAPREVPNVTAPFYHGAMSHQGLERLWQARAAIAKSRPDLSSRWKPLDELEPERNRARLAQNPVRAVQEEVIPASEVANAIRQGKVAVFDATPLLPKELFNLSLADIAQMHGDLADEIPICRQRGASAMFGCQSLRLTGNRLESLERAGKLYHGDQVTFPREPHRLYPAPPTAGWLVLLRSLVLLTGPRFMQNPEAVLHSLRRPLLQPTTNVRRLPKLPKIELETTLGNPPWLERVWSLLWAGAVGSWWHNDEADNLLIATRGEMTVAVFEQRDTDAISGMRGPVHAFAAQGFDLTKFNPEQVSDMDWLRRNQWLHKFPFIRVHLKPGMGVTVPSRTYHTIYTEDSDRLLLNAFMVPRYKAMEDAPAGKDSFFGAGRQSEPYMSLLHLKYSSLFRLWDTQKLGGFFEMFKLEIF